MTSENQGEIVPASETRLTHLIGPSRRGLTARHLQFIAIGGAIASGLFLGSAAGIKSAGDQATESAKKAGQKSTEDATQRAQEKADEAQKKVVEPLEHEPGTKGGTEEQRPSPKPAEPKEPGGEQ